MAEIKNDRLGLYGAECSKCNYMIALGFKGLSPAVLESDSFKLFCIPDL